MNSFEKNKIEGEVSPDIKMEKEVNSLDKISHIIGTTQKMVGDFSEKLSSYGREIKKGVVYGAVALASLTGIQKEKDSVVNEYLNDMNELLEGDNKDKKEEDIERGRQALYISDPVEYEQRKVAYDDSLKVHNIENEFNAEFLSHFDIPIKDRDKEMSGFKELIELTDKKQREQITGTAKDITSNGFPSQKEGDLHFYADKPNLYRNARMAKVGKPVETRSIWETSQSDEYQIVKKVAGRWDPKFKLEKYKKNSEANQKNFFDRFSFLDDTKNAEHSSAVVKRTTDHIVERDYVKEDSEDILGNKTSIYSHGFPRKSVVTNLKPLGHIDYSHGSPWYRGDNDPEALAYNDGVVIGGKIPYYKKPVQEVHFVKPTPISEVKKIVKPVNIPVTQETSKGSEKKPEKIIEPIVEKTPESKINKEEVLLAQSEKFPTRERISRTTYLQERNSDYEYVHDLVLAKKGDPEPYFRIKKDEPVSSK